MSAGCAAVLLVEEEDENRSRDGERKSSKQDYVGLQSESTKQLSRNGPAILQTIFRVLEARGPKEALNLLRDVLESMKLVQAITGTGAAASFVHANTYADSRGEAFGVLTALSTILAFLSLIVTVIIYVSLGLLEHEDMAAVEGYLVRYWTTIACLITGSICSMVLLVSAVVVDAFRAYSKTAAIGLLATTLLGFLMIVVFWVSSMRYIFTSGTGLKFDAAVTTPLEESEYGSEGNCISSEGNFIVPSAPTSPEMSETSECNGEQDMGDCGNGVFRLRCS